MTAVLLLALAVGAPGPKEAPPKDPPSLVGEWALTSRVVGGKPEAPSPGSSVTFTADGRVRLREGRAERAEQATYTADPKKTPAELDIVPPARANEPVLKAIYKVDGDTLTICFGGGGDRPTAFESPAGAGVMLVTFTRAKKKE
jgi:uncharacterized protein (TIGR03067 family)